MMKIYAGIEGGASFSKVILLDEKAKTLARLEEEPSTNIWLIGREEWAKRIEAMIRKALDEAKLNKQTTIECVGLCLSGCEDENDNQLLEKFLLKQYPNLAKHYKVASDTIGSLMTGSPNGGIVLIAGTGSNSLLYCEDGTRERCGGWGHLIGDYGSAYWITMRMVQYLIEADENYNPIPYDTTEARKALFEHFGIDSTMSLLKPLYQEFNKTHVARFCARIAKLAIEKKDPLAIKVFEDAGEVLAKHVVALLPKIKTDEIPVICVGSVWKSWCLLEKSFFATIGPKFSKKLSIRQLTQSSAIGAAYFAAKSAGFDLPINFAENFTECVRHQNGFH